MDAGQGLFISHASADRRLADLLRDTLVLGGVPEDRIFYSSARATGIPSGADVRSHLRERLRTSGLAIELISRTFLQRPMCLIELGGAWALNVPTYPIVVPPLTRDEASKQIGDVHMGLLGNDDDLNSVFDELSDRISRDVTLSPRATAWNNATRGFKSRFLNTLSEASSIVAEPGQTRRLELDRSPNKTEVRGVESATQISGQTRQEELSPLLQRISVRYNKSTINIKIPDHDVWLQLSTSLHHQSGEDLNIICIYFSDPQLVESPSLDAFVNWSEGRSIAEALKRVSNVLSQNAGRREAANFNAGEIIDELKQKIIEITG